jgi:hypothetical protein
MKDLLLTLLHLAVMTAKLCGPGGGRAVIAENLLLKQQLIVLRRGGHRAPNLTLSDRLNLPELPARPHGRGMWYSSRLLAVSSSQPVWRPA